ncbi:ubiquinone biosynthesis protein COQ4 KNAG_0A04590 [Huiozyma naganishii CBS 8797]|uniref:4-hydroxy-3-methoxy-5-polyprenylbenzoate decarboxylase n=1 Tax=Huiozyma naganishii (strain ATCC MYA-139 / BCRC 22969 / CBS 8797 / KCTC 17520 / NBRC 10181 / NCYC 3082 / Yp74L-3) TaxID=1071383 RepID=J7S3R0_HUIN7|nr:hypothetical protein KNAG_0A04590 [Kazachstania naganishii CBS 8797]CCK68131.1 hypothetical protein KNAG_0A04590 [Kazachstania naganishii CBS 8797]
MFPITRATRKGAFALSPPQNRTLLLEALAGAVLGDLVFGRQAQLADKMHRGELHNRHDDYEELQKERTERRLRTLRDTRPSPPNYPGHIPLHTSEKLLMFLVSGVRAFFHPENGINIVQLGEASAFPVFLESLKNTMLSDTTGRRILRDKPDVKEDILKMETLEKLPKNTFGYVFYQWCRRQKVTPDTRAQVQYVDDPVHAFVFKRFRQCHDFYHALNNAPIVIEGEITIKALEAANMGVPMAALGALLAPLRLKPVQRKRLYEIYLPWAVRSGLSCKPLINVYWEEQLMRDVGELRAELGIYPPPDLRAMREARKAEIKELTAKYNILATKGVLR